MSGSRKKAAMYAAAVGCTRGTIGLFVNVVSGYGIRSLELTVSRMVIAAAVLGICFLIRGRNLFRVRAGDPIWLGVAGVPCLLFFNVNYGTAIERSSMSVTTVLLYTSPVFVTPIAVPVLKEKLSLRELVAVLLATIGYAFVFGIVSGKVTFPTDAFLWGMGAALGYVIYSTVAGVLLKRHYPPAVLFYAFLTVTAVGYFLVDMKHMVYSISQYLQLGVVLVVSARVCNIFPYPSYSAALKHMEVGRASVIAPIEPVVASFLGVATLGEPMDFCGASRVICILGAIVMLNRQSGVKKYEGETSDTY